MSATETGRSEKRDVVLLTIDCWRYDAPSEMPHFQELTSDFQKHEAICQAAATNGVFPAILASQYSHEVYRTEDPNLVGDSVMSLPKLLSRRGYKTGAFLASNPFLGKWASHFDEFWNDGMRNQNEGANRSEYSEFDRIRNFLKLESRVTAPEVATRARRWLDGTDSPRFLWMHLMDIHAPYYPGLRRGVTTGLLKNYYSLVQYSRYGMDAPDSVLDTIRDLYWECVNRLDERIQEVIQFLPEDSIIVVMADHGEELHHGNIGHARLYEECVRVPLFVRHPDISMDESPIRQLDVAPTIAEWVNVAIPDSWTGEPYDGEPRESIILNHSHGQERVYVGLRTSSAKLIEAYDMDGNKIDTEFYDLEADPTEQQPILDHSNSSRQAVSRKLERHKQKKNLMSDIFTNRANATDAVEKRLKELGYR
ncbi:sulfatase-like hydrolase/transferase [Haloarcula sp. NS06]|uniref:sulfatase-like hydrolase/transferase n=1 Tax=Haloarcula sp. NS06 TaxID=3409688 RepID=UPI003DA794AA